MEKTKTAVHERLTNEIRFWDHRARDLRHQEEAGRPNAKLNSNEARKRADELQARLQKRNQELEEELKHIKWSIVGLAETRRVRCVTKLVSGNVLYTNGQDNKSQAGVGFLVHKDIAKNVIEFRGASERTAMLTVKLNSRYSVKIIQVYAPTSAYSDEIVESM